MLQLDINDFFTFSTTICVQNYLYNDLKWCLRNCRLLQRLMHCIGIVMDNESVIHVAVLVIFFICTHAKQTRFCVFPNTLGMETTQSLVCTFSRQMREVFLVFIILIWNVPFHAYEELKVFIILIWNEQYIDPKQTHMANLHNVTPVVSNKRTWLICTIGLGRPITINKNLNFIINLAKFKKFAIQTHAKFKKFAIQTHC